MSAPLVEHFFRHEYGRLVAQLARKVGIHHIELVEDAVQGALATALDAWPAGDVPDDPSAWLYRVAINHLLGDLRKETKRARILGEVHDADAGEVATARFANEVHDDLLRMLFVCCDDAIPRESRLVLALKTLCGFSTAEIALRLFTSETSVHKRLQRARDTLRTSGRELAPATEALPSRVGSVHEVLYLLFNEGYLSTHPEVAIRRELCAEAIRLTTVLAEHPIGATPQTFALLALMYFHASRLVGRTDASGGLLLLEEQDRSQWDTEQMQLGVGWLARSAEGDQFSRYHAEAGIAAEHCFAPSFRETRWKEIADLYALLERIAPSPLYTLNRAVAVAEAGGVGEALAILDGIVPPSWLAASYLWDAVRADLYRRANQDGPFEHHRQRAIASAPSDAVRELLARRLARR